jgi:protein involved in sex pheromone biosynthesis
MKLTATLTLLALVAVLAGCLQPMTEEERESQKRAEQERRIKSVNTGY